MLKYLLSGFIGILIGVLCSVLVNSTLIEISLSRIFSVYFGCIFILIGCLLLWRNYTQNKSSGPVIVRRPSDSFFAHPYMIYVYSGLMIFSGTLCFFLTRSWFTDVNYKVKIPFYGIVGANLSFVLVSFFGDCLNACISNCQGANSRPIIESNQQLYLIVASSTLMGFLYGLIFGILGIEDADLYRLAVATMKENSYSYPIGISIGGITGVLNEIMRRNGGDLIVTSNQYAQEI